MPLFGFAAHAYCASLLPEYGLVGALYEPLAVGLSVLVAPLVGLVGGGRRREWAPGQRAFVVLLDTRAGGWLFVLFAGLAVALPFLLALSFQAVGYSEVMFTVGAIFYLVGAGIVARIVRTLVGLRVLTLGADGVTITGALGAPLNALAIAAATDRTLVVDVDFGPPQCLWLPVPLVRVPDEELDAQLRAVVAAVKSMLPANATGRDS